MVGIGNGHFGWNVKMVTLVVIDKMDTLVGMGKWSLWLAWEKSQFGWHRKMVTLVSMGNSHFGWHAKMVTLVVIVKWLL